MSIGKTIYLFLLGVCCALALNRRNSGPGLRVMPYLFFASFATEIIVLIFFNLLHKPYLWIYHLYIPIEFSLYSIYFLLVTQSAFQRRIIQLAVVAFILVSLSYSWKVNFEGFPGLIYNLEGLFLIWWSITQLFTINISMDVPIIRLPVFWICFGILLFHSGIFFVNFVYNHLSVNRVGLAKQLNQLIITNLNCLLYIFFVVAFLCPIRMKKSI